MNPPIPRHILIVRLSAIGDVIHTLPCLHALRRSYPGARIGWVVEEMSAKLLEGHPEIDDLFVIPKKRWRKHPLLTLWTGEKSAFYRRLRQGEWDLAIDFQGLSKSGWVAWRSGAPVRMGYAGKDGREFNKFFTTHRFVPAASQSHVIRRNLSLLESLDIETAEEEVAFRFPDFSPERAEMAAQLARDGIEGPFIALYPGAGWETKRWPSTRFAAFARLLAQPGPTAAAPLPQVLVWGPGELKLCEEIVRLAELPRTALRIAPATNLRQLAGLFQSAATVVGGDTGPVHLAAALGTPVVALYGGSDSVRNGPWGPRVTVLQAVGPDCVPCWKTHCKFKRFVDCLQSIPLEQVAQAVRNHLNPE